MSDVFISYKSEDRDTAERLAQELQRRGLSVWWDRDIPVGRSYDEVIEEQLHTARCVVVLWSEASVGSDWVKAEAEEGAHRNILVPVRIEPVDPPLSFRRIQTADLSDWHGESGAQQLDKLIDAIETKLRRADSRAPSPDMPDSHVTTTPSTVLSRSGLADSRSSLLVGGALAGVVAILAGIVWFGFLRDGASDGDGFNDRMPRDQAAAEIEALVANDVDWAPNYQKRPGQLDILPPDPHLPPIDQFPLVVASNPNAVAAEIFVSTEKSGSGSDGWMVEVAQAFNDAGVRLADGRLANVEIRKIASGIGYEYIANGQSLPDAYSPSNHLWIEMAKASGVTMTPVREQLVDNVAGLVLRSDNARQLREEYGTLDGSTLIQAVIDDKLVMGYTDPFASSTGLNFLITVLWELSGGDEEAMLTPGVEQTFRDFQSHVPFVALTTLQIRDSVVRGGQLDAFVMEHQTFVQTDVLSDGYDFIPFGIRHDNPLYSVGNIDGDTREVLELFAQYAERPEYAALARDYGFDPAPYTDAFPVPDGDTLISAQHLWKDNKDGGKPVTAVFVADVSGSMQGSRIFAVRNALDAGIGLIGEQNLVGLVTFSDTVTQVLPVAQFDLEQKRLFKGAIEDMRIGGGTAMYDAISVALTLLEDEIVENPEAKPMVIVLTDGQTKDGLGFDDVSDAIEGLRIPIYTIGFEADIDELAKLSALVEAASIDANEDDVEFQIGRLFNAQL